MYMRIFWRNSTSMFNFPKDEEGKFLRNIGVKTQYILTVCGCQLSSMSVAGGRNIISYETAVDICLPCFSLGLLGDAVLEMHVRSSTHS